MMESDPYAKTGDFDGDQTAASDVGGAPFVPPERIGRYKIERLLGEGGFGLVFLARDEQLERMVALKIPHQRHITSNRAIDFYLAEAQTVARLDHPNIVPVYDIGTTEDVPLYFVSKYVEGADLAAHLRQTRITGNDICKLVATMADALHHAHKHGVVHRDVKPANTLIDERGTPYLVDFGLALKEADKTGRMTRYVGTAAYMSPEQARGEGHRVDGRSDIFSLGVVFYELLTGHKPFRADSHSELLEHVKTFDPRPPRQLDDSIPRELERICLKAMSKRASERFTTAKDFADELRQFLSDQTVDFAPGDHDTTRIDSFTTARTRSSRSASASGSLFAQSASISMPSWEKEPLSIIPKGLRSFDSHDADFFLELLPGPYDREGLPDSLRFWKTRIEELVPDKTFPVGLMYGPSGCGKSSLVKAGLLPRLQDSVNAHYVEATADETESRMLTVLQRSCQGLPEHLGLVEALGCLRSGQYLGNSEKVVLVLDQFEQWLHAHRQPENTELVAALRQCDGGRVQCILMVRDDFWMAATRLMRELDIKLVEGHNSAAVDLFSVRHASKVLTAFGRAFGDLEIGTKLSKSQQQFIQQSVAGLAEDGKVVCVRLALFAEMMKGRPWIPATLREVGGASGVGVAFLEETFSSTSASPERRYHAKAARAMLRALLPASGTDIKGHMRSKDELLKESGDSRSPADFEDLLRILDTELKLVTPTDHDGLPIEERSDAVTGSRQAYYQLTHDYLVPALREWLSRKLKETRSGRASLRLEEIAELWNARREERRRLPGWWEWATLATLTKSRQWTQPQKEMMRAAAKTHGLTAACILVLVVALCFAGYELNGRTRAGALVEKLKSAEIQRIPQIVDELAPYRRWANAGLRALVEHGAADSVEHTYASLALLPGDENQATFLRERMLKSEPFTLTVIRDELARHGHDLRDWLWQRLDGAATDETTRFRAALALAPTDSKSERWQKVAKFIGYKLVDAAASRPSEYPPLVNSLRPIRKVLFGPLSNIFEDADPVRRKMATGLLIDYAADQPDVLIELLMVADRQQFKTILPLLDACKPQAIAGFSQVVLTPLSAKESEPQKERLAQRQANAAAALLHFGKSAGAWNLLKQSSDLRARTYLIHRMARLGVDPGLVVTQLPLEQDVSVRRALLLALGEYPIEAIQLRPRTALVAKVVDWYVNEPDAGVHSAAEWLLRTWNQKQKLADAQKKLLPAGGTKRSWRVTKAGHTMIAIDARRVAGISRQFEMSSTEVTVEQFRQFKLRHYVPDENDRPEAAIGVVTWHTAIAYCQYLNEQAKVPPDQWCYPPVKQIANRLQFAVKLDRTGYRLPTLAEWKYANRALTTTSRYYGETDLLLSKYGWFKGNSGMRVQLVGRLKPNDFGFFDLLGNVAEWTTDRVYDDRVVITGGTYGSGPDRLKVSESAGALPNTKFNSYGFRVVRTVKRKNRE